MKKTILFSLLLAGAMVVSAKTYTISLPDAARVGNSTLKPGDYKVKLDGSKALFFNMDNHQAAEATVQVQSEQKKYEYTAVETRTVGGSDQVRAIELGGTRTRLQLD